MKPLEKIKEIKAAHEDNWMALSRVQAVGIGLLKNGETGIVISVDKYDVSLVSLIPEQIEGVFVEIVESGTFHAL
ncbi:MAG: hypothetical protein DWQ10_00070 [Calditrichaeota bacterium]|nr:MAG: hypothetical protein DWQ10_00070 [Calditrichota bacterium]